MAINIKAKKRGWGYDTPNTLLNAYVDGAAVVALSANTTTGVASLGVSMTFTATAAISHAALEGIVVYTPSTVGSGGSVPLGVRARATLSEGCTSTLYMYGIQTQLHFANTSTLAGSVAAALRVVTTNTGTTTWTSGILTGIYIDHLIDDDIVAGGVRSSLIRMANNGGTLDTMISFYCSASTTTLFNFEDDSGIFTNISGGGVHGGTVQKIRVDFAGTPYYMIMSTAPTS